MYLRHELLKEHFQRRRNEIDEGGGEVGMAEPEWFPAGVTPSHFPWEGQGEGFEGMTVAEEVQMYQMTWMDSQTLSTRELHKAASHIERLVPARQENIFCYYSQLAAYVRI